MTKLSDIILPLESFEPVWTDVESLGDGVEFFVRPSNTPEYTRATRVQFRVLALDMRKNRGDADITDRRNEIDSQSVAIEAEILAASEALIVGWSGIVDEDGHDVPFSPELAYRIFAQNESAFDEVMAFSRDLADRRKAERESAEGNSARSQSVSSGALCDQEKETTGSSRSTMVGSP